MEMVKSGKAITLVQAMPNLMVLDMKVRFFEWNIEPSWPTDKLVHYKYNRICIRRYPIRSVSVLDYGNHVLEEPPTSEHLHQ